LEHLLRITDIKLVDNKKTAKKTKQESIQVTILTTWARRHTQTWVNPWTPTVAICVQL